MVPFNLERPSQYLIAYSFSVHNVSTPRLKFNRGDNNIKFLRNHRGTV